MALANFFGTAPAMPQLPNAIVPHDTMAYDMDNTRDAMNAPYVSWDSKNNILPNDYSHIVSADDFDLEPKYDASFLI